MTATELKGLLNDDEIEEWRVCSLIEKHVATEAQVLWLSKEGLTVTDVLHGNFPSDKYRAKVRDLLDDWNKRLGFEYFQVPRPRPKGRLP